MDKQLMFEKNPESYWLATTEMTSFPRLSEDINVDILIIGGGFVGITCAYELMNEGFNIAILESNKILHGTTAYTTAKITSQHGLIYNRIKKQMGLELAKQYAEANQKAISEIKRIVDENNIDCDYISEQSFIYTTEDAYIQSIEDEIETAKDIDIPASYVDSIPFNMSIKAAIKFDGQAQFHPRKFLLGLTDVLKDKGIMIYENSRAVEIQEDKGYRVLTSQGKNINASRVIIASHYPFYNKQGMYFGKLYSERSYILAIKAQETYPGGMYINEGGPARSLRNQNDHNTGELIFVGGEHHKTGQGVPTNEHYGALLDFANTLFTVEDVPFRWSTQDCMTLDGVPYVGYFTEKTPDLYVATGFGKWGMTNSVVSSLIIKDLILHGESPWQDVYNPSRKTIMASAKNFITQNYNVAEQLLDGKLSPLPEKTNLEAGKSKVLKIEGERVGVYRDEGGTLHTVDTTCTHMGCELNWNESEKSWDCPCHGSRFTYKGEIISGPAVKPLETGKDVKTIEKLLKDDF